MHLGFLPLSHTAVPCLCRSPLHVRTGFLLAGLLVSATACSARTAEPPAPSSPPTSSAPLAPAPASGSPASPQQAATPGSPPDTPHAPVDAVSEASRPYEPGPEVLAEGSVDGTALRASVARRLKGDRSPVTVLRGGTALELGERLCQVVVPKVPAEKPVLIKPNIGGFAWFKNPARHGGDNGVAGRITDPAFVRGIIRCLRARGPSRDHGGRWVVGTAQGLAAPRRRLGLSGHGRGRGRAPGSHERRRRL